MEYKRTSHIDNFYDANMELLRFLSSSNALVSIHCYCTEIFKHVSFYVLQRKYSHTGW